MTEPGPMGPWTFKDLAAHLLGWRERTIDRLEAAADGREAPAPAWPSELDDDDSINAWIQARSDARSVRAVLDDVDRSYDRLADAIAALPEDLVTSRRCVPVDGGRVPRRHGTCSAISTTSTCRRSAHGSPRARLTAAHAVPDAGLPERRRRVYDAVHDRDRRRDADLPPLHRRGVVRVHLGRDVREPQPGRHDRRRGSLPAGHEGRRGDGHQGGRDRLSDVAPDAGAQARRDPVRVRGADGRAQGAPRAGDDPRDGQGPRGGSRRRPGRHRHRLPDGRRGPPDGRRHRPVRAPRQVGDEHPPAARGGRDRHALELPDGDPVLEDDARPRHRATRSCSSRRPTRPTAPRSSSS